jgi:hypothetical protein
LTFGLVSALPIVEDARLGALDAGDAALVLDRLATLLMYARETEQIAGKLRATGMEDEGSTHSDAARGDLR